MRLRATGLRPAWGWATHCRQELLALAESGVTGPIGALLHPSDLPSASPTLTVVHFSLAVAARLSNPQEPVDGVGGAQGV